jgi:ribosomal protein S18 acetylase RimI-like enzyme
MQIIVADDSCLSPIYDLDNLVLGNYNRKEYLKKSVVSGNCYVALLNNHVIGFIIFDTSFYENAFIWLVIVEPNYRRQGIAKALIQHVQAICPTQKLFTSTNESNDVMSSLCETLGFVRSGIIENLDDDDPEIVYYKKLG